METPIKIDFQGMETSPATRTAILERVAVLEDRYGRITAGRIVIRAPMHHHSQGAAFEVHIHLSLPNGREVNVAVTPGEDERHADPHYAINDAFKRARRQLQDHVRRLQGKVKTHQPAPWAIVARIDAEKGFGFIRTADEREIYFHRNSVLDDAFGRLKVGTRVYFSEELGEKGPQASTVKLTGKHSLS